jgi:hypothetical protein
MKMNPQPKPGDPVIVRLFDARKVQGTICVSGIMQTVSGTKIRVRSGCVTTSETLLNMHRPNRYAASRSETQT